MDDISRAVNSFASPELQSKVAGALLASFERTDTELGIPDFPGLRVVTDPGRSAEYEDPVPEVPDDSEEYSVLRYLDLHGSGSPSFQEFAESCSVENADDQCLVAVYWLARKADLSPVTVDQVYTCFRAAGWSIPDDLGRQLCHAWRMGLLSSARYDDLVMSDEGIERVERNLFQLAGF